MVVIEMPILLAVVVLIGAFLGWVVYPMLYLMLWSRRSGSGNQED